MTATEQHMALARAEAGCPDDETLVIHCRELRADLDAERAARKALVAALRSANCYCREMHHEKADRHENEAPCPVEARIAAALALAAKLP